MNAITLKGIPQIDTFPPRIAVMGEDEPPRTQSRYLDNDGRLTCPSCGCHDFRVPDSDPWVRGSKTRYRCCRHCGLRVKTKEIVDDV